jgi:8-oxo-dGTP diphosphatase
MRTSKIFVTVDCIVFKKHENGNHILFVKRKNDPYKGNWALPGGFLDEGEDLQIGAARELTEETGLVIAKLEQLGAFGKPGRDPRQHTVSIAYVGFADADAKAVGADDAEEARWFPVNALPELAFDHADIVNTAFQKYKVL